MNQNEQSEAKKRIVSEISATEYAQLQNASDMRKSTLSSTIRYAVCEYLEHLPK